MHRRAFDGAIDRVLEGESLSSALARTACFPDLVLDRLAVGENTGNVVPCLRDIATTYQQKISRQLNMFTKVIASVILARLRLRGIHRDRHGDGGAPGGELELQGGRLEPYGTS